ncbi:hypothetical protein BGX26_012962 [Mortierella sp. AD094]|nr:hypothetical protein BGX26_012962 [Mortierella sp. AD094]
MAAVSLRLDGLSEVTELESIPLPYKTLYHTLVFKNEMPIDLLRERHQTGSQQLLTWIKVALKLLESVSESQQYEQRQQLDEDEDEELEAEIQDIVSGFGQYEPTIESSIEILLQLEETIAHRSSSSTSSSSAYDLDEGFNESRECLSPEMEILQEQWSHLRGIIGDLTGSVREHQRLRDGIQSVRNTSEQTLEATGILEKCLRDIAADRQRTSEIALAEAASRNSSSSSLSSHDSTASLRARAQSSGVDSNDMLELDSRIGLLTIQIDTLQKTYPECTRNHKSYRSKSRSIKQQETGSIAEKKHLIYKLFKELCKSWHSLRTRRDQLWRDLEECDRWRTRIEKMAKQIETMLEPVEIFHKMCVNLLTTLDGQASTGELSAHGSQLSLTIATLDITEAGKPRILTGSKGGMTSSITDEPVDLELLWSTLQELDEKQNMVAPAIENMFWVQEGEIQHRSKTAALSPTTPTTTHSQAPHPHHQFPPESATSVTPPSSDNSPMYPSLDMLERQRNLKSRWSNLKTSLDTVGTKLHAHHAHLKEKANQALNKKEEPAEDKTLIGSGNSVDGGDWTSTIGATSPILRRSMTSSSQKSTTSTNISPNWSESSNRFLRGKLVSSISMDSPVVKKFMLVKSDMPAWDKPRPWCPSISTSSPSMPGFPLQTSSWGYYILSPSEEHSGQIVATPAPPPMRSPTPAPKPEPPKINRPPFSPGGNRRYTALSQPPPPRPMPSRSASVAGYNNNKSNASSTYITASGDPMDWTQTLRKSTSCSTTKPMVFGSKSHNANASTTSFASSKPRRSFSIDPRAINRRKSMTMSPTQRTESAASHYTIQSWRGHELSTAGSHGQQSNHNNGNGKTHNKNNNGRRGSLSSISDASEDGTIMGTTRHKEHRGVRAMFKKNSSTSSLDSMISSVSSNLSSVFEGIGNTFGSSMVSSLGGSSSNARSPSPYNNMFGSSFAAARSSAALHSAFMASMSSSSSASLRQQSNSSLSGGESKSRQEQRRRDKNQREQISKIVGGATTTSSASSWMSSMNTGSILSALSFTVPTYNGADV